MLNSFIPSRYSTRVQALANVYRDRPMGPMATAVYWVEYVIRHQGAPHMKSPAKDLNMFQRSSLDVISFLLGVVVIFFVALWYLFKGARWVFRLVCKKRRTSVKSKIN